MSTPPPSALRSRRRTRWLAFALLTGALGGGALIAGCASFGALPEGQRLQRIRRSPQWRQKQFVNSVPTAPGLREGSMSKVLWETLTSGAIASPEVEPPIQPRLAGDFATPPKDGLRITWLGHSTMLIEIDGTRILTDPVWADRASPFQWVGPERFHRPPLPLGELPEVDAVVISHDHYDHLDMETIQTLARRGTQFYVPLGIGAHLEYWDVPAAQFQELEWWNSVEVGSLTLISTPARHFSGRSLRSRNKTLWCSWTLIGPEHRVFFSGDTGYFPGFKEIGKRFGPFDLTMLEVGAYHPAWGDIHLGPVQAVRAHQDLRGKVFLPVHWGTFDLGLHAWTQPMERALIVAQREGVVLRSPRPGGSVHPLREEAIVRWWPDVPFQKDPHGDMELAARMLGNGRPAGTLARAER